MNLSKILAPVDFSENSPHAVEYAAALAGMAGAGLRLVHVLEISPYEVYQQLGIFDGVPPAALAGAMEAEISGQGMMDKARRESLARLEDLLARSGYRPKGAAKGEVAVRQGKVVDEILAEIAETKSDLVVVATHGWTGLNHLLMGSTAEKLVRVSPVAVLTLRSGKT
ncbi:MAG: universal stress protein [Deltaproteobacteria bacterium]|nr:universal stress protein [Deltaproteobacteria bacterium]